MNKNRDDNRMDIYSVLSHPFRRKILLLLEKEGYVPYSSLMDKLGVEATGQLNFHLKKLGSLINKDKKSYFLTEDGKRILKILNINTRILLGENIDEYLKSRGSEISRVGVIICNCNTEISNAINLSALELHIKKLNHVVSVSVFENLCQQKNFEKIKNWVKENFLNKIVIAACSPKTHQHIFEKFLEDVIDRANLEIANIREQCVWVHPIKDSQIAPEVVLEKVCLYVEAAIERVVLQKKVKIKRVSIEKSCAVIGGGIAGMTLALDLARAGIQVYLIEKSPTLGGKVARWNRIFNMGDCSICFISELIAELVKEKNIKIITNAEIENVSGEVGNFTINLIKKPRFIDIKKCTGCKQCIEVCSIEKPNRYEFGLSNRKIIYIPFIHSYPFAPVIDDEDIQNCLMCRICERACVNNAINLDQKSERIRVKVGTKVFAIGADFFWDLDDYNYNPQNDIITSPEFERILASDGPTEGKILKLSNLSPPKSISIIQNVGNSHDYLEFNDKIALKYVNEIKLKLPECDVRVIYNFNAKMNLKPELMKHLDFNLYFSEKIEVVEKNGEKYVKVNDNEYPSEMIILNINLIPNPDLKTLRKSLDFTLDDEGYMSEETLASGIYGVGTSLGPLSYHETIASTKKVALEIISLLSKDSLIAEFSGVVINEEKCGMCGLCLKSCPYNAIVIEVDKINIDKFKCKGCGTCVSICPTGAIEMNIDTSEKINKTIQVFSKFRRTPKILAFCCRSCGYAAADDAGLKKIPYSPNIFTISVPCTGRVDTKFILKAFKVGFDGVIILGCRKDACRFIDGVEKVEKKLRYLLPLVEKDNLNRIILKHLNAVEGNKFADILNNFYLELGGEV